MEIGTRIREIRLNNKMKINELANAIGISRVYLSDIERNIKLPTLELLQRICNYFSITLSEFFAEDKPKVEPELIYLLNEIKKLTPEEIRLLTKLIQSMKGDTNGAH